MLRSILYSLRSSLHVVKVAAGSPASSAPSLLPNVQSRTITVSSVACLKQIEQVTEENVTKIEGKIVESERSPYVIKREEEQVGCTLCKIHPHLKYTDVLILSQFLRPDGCLLPRQVTGVCRSQQRRLEVLVNKSQRAGLLPQFRPALKSGKPRTNHRSNYKWKQYNVYFKD